MLTVAIRQRVRDNLNRDDVGIDTKIQGWINDIKRDLETLFNMDYMRKVVTLQATHAAPSPALPARFKEAVIVRYRRILPAPAEVVWSPLPRLDESEVLAVEGYDGSGAPVTGTPRGFTLEESTLTVHPAPTSGDTYEVRLVYYEFSEDWAFGDAEEPYLARHAWAALIERATALGLAFLGEGEDSEHREVRGDRAIRRWRAGEAARELKGPLELRPRTGAADDRASRPLGLRSL